MVRGFAALPRRLYLVVMLLGAALIAVSSLPYLDFQQLPPFMIEKLPLRFPRLWLFSLRVHVFSAVISFPLCLLLMTRTLQRRPPWHRWLGRVTGLVILLALVPTGMVLAMDAKGGAIVSAGFLLSGLIVLVAMAHGILAARRRDFVAHRRDLYHVVAQMSVAVTSRALMIGLDMLEWEPELAYVVALWVPVLASAGVAELLARRVRSTNGWLRGVGRALRPVEFARIVSRSNP
jgi:uncharacterized membrane protein